MRCVFDQWTRVQKMCPLARTYVKRSTLALFCRGTLFYNTCINAYPHWSKSTYVSLSLSLSLSLSFSLSLFLSPLWRRVASRLVVICLAPFSFTIFLQKFSTNRLNCCTVAIVSFFWVEFCADVRGCVHFVSLNCIYSSRLIWFSISRSSSRVFRWSLCCDLMSVV